MRGYVKTIRLVIFHVSYVPQIPIVDGWSRLPCSVNSLHIRSTN
ncbi:hypothetical protein BH10ACI4_BH10ACI4_31050 [soil metagenome]